ncbi:MAG: putative DNA binding domain-containing protein [Chloroflexi bacterium]|nr:putative DNA binding domain-containing protein [Chloroflexota bacterium]
MDLKELLRKGRGQLLEFMPQPDAEALAETLVAFANADGGTILVGLSTTGMLLEEVEPEHLEAVLLRAQGMCRPPVKTEWQALETPSGTAVAISVPRSPELHSLFDGRVLLRSGEKNRPLSGEEIRHLASAKGAGEYELEAVPGATLDDFDQGIIAEYAAKRRLRGPRGEQLSEQELLLDSGAINAEGKPTVAGLLLFGRNPQRMIPHSDAVLVRFAGTTPTNRDGLPGYTRREEIRGALCQIIDKLWNIIWEEMRHETVIHGLEREERPEYPPAAVREAIVNAVAHRDYRITGRRIEVRMFDDRLEIISPGGLPGHITLDNIVEEHFSRNPRIVRGLFYWGFIEELGLGIDRMIDEMLQAGHPRPQFEATPFSFKVILRNVRERPASKWEKVLNERQIKALEYLQEHDRITNREYHDLCPHVTPETLRLDLADMVEKGILLRIGDKKGAYYILK